MSSETLPHASDTTVGARPRVVIVGAGLAGLVAARRLAESCDVTVLEASDRIGGQLWAIEAPRRGGGSLPVDVGAESMHLGAPHVAALVRELGLDEAVLSARPGTSALLSRGRLVPLPAGVGPTGPTQLWPVVKSGILSVKGLVRAGLEPLAARRRYPGNISVGAFVTRRFGREVADTFVEPLLGNLHSGNIHGLGVAETAPQLAPVAAEGRSLVMAAIRKGLSKRKTGGQPPSLGQTNPGQAKPLPMFASLPGGLTTLTDALAADPRITVRTQTPATSLERDGQGWVVWSNDQRFDADQVILAASSETSTALTADLCPEVGTALAWVRQASVATVVLGYDRADVAANDALSRFNGLMLNPHQAVTLKAMTNLSRKWPTLAESEHHLVRVSVGRSTHLLAATLTDDELIERCTAELGELIGLSARPTFATVARFPRGLPQLGPGHCDRLARAKQALAEAAPGLHLTGAAVDGLGISSTVKAGNQVAAQTLVAVGR